MLAIGVNTGLISAAELPFGGIKESGIGREVSKRQIRVCGISKHQNGNNRQYPYVVLDGPANQSYVIGQVLVV
jgi:hypothetical protein